MDEKILKLQHKMKKKLDEYRYEHTLGVMYTAAALAMSHEVDMERALLAGLLHDCAKCIPNDKKKKNWRCAKNTMFTWPISKRKIRRSYMRGLERYWQRKNMELTTTRCVMLFPAIRPEHLP